MKVDGEMKCEYLIGLAWIVAYIITVTCSTLIPEVLIILALFLLFVYYILKNISIIYKCFFRTILEPLKKILIKFKQLLNDMKKIITFVGLLCVFIIGFAIFNNISFKEEMQSKKTTELSRDSLFHRQVEMQDLLLGKSSLLDSMNLDNRSSNLIIKKEIQKIRDNSDEILKLQKKIYQNNKK